MVAQQLSRDPSVPTHSASGQTPKSLDERYLDFKDRTARIFAEMPELEPLRHFIFKDLLIQRRADNRIEIMKHWLRPLVRRNQSKGTLAQADVLILVESSREVIVDALLPVYRALVARGIKVQLVSSGGPADLPDSTADFRYPARAVAPNWAKQAWNKLCDEIGELRDRSLQRTFFNACANNRGLLLEINRLLNIVRPKVVVAASTQLSAGAALLTSARLRSLTLLLQHGILQPFYTPLLADYMLTWGKSSNDVLADLGVSRSRLIALGSPRHDSMKTLTKGNHKNQLLEMLSLPKRPTFVFFSNGNDLVRNGNAPVECAEWLESMASRYASDVNVVVRLHPNEDGSLYQHCPHVKVSKASPDLATTLEGSDWVGSLCSTVLYDALLYHKPILQFYADGWPELAVNWKSGLAKRISSRTELEEMVGRAPGPGNGEYVRDALIDHVFANHGRASEKIADFVQDQLEERRTNRTSGKARMADRLEAQVAEPPFSELWPNATLLRKLIRSPRTLALLLSDRFLVPIWMRLNKIQTGNHCRFVGQPVLNLAPGARVRLGDDVLVNSRFDSNPAGLPHPTIFAALESNSSIEIGDGTGISGASIVARSMVTIGKRVLIGAGACIWDTDFHPLDPDKRRQHPTQGAKCAPITIEDEVFIGARSLILKGVSIGRGAVIGAGSVVTKNVNAGDIVAGNPARKVGTRISQQD